MGAAPTCGCGRQPQSWLSAFNLASCHLTIYRLPTSRFWGSGSQGGWAQVLLPCEDSSGLPKCEAQLVWGLLSGCGLQEIFVSNPIRGLEALTSQWPENQSPLASMKAESRQGSSSTLQTFVSLSLLDPMAAVAKRPTWFLIVLGQKPHEGLARLN